MSGGDEAGQKTERDRRLRWDRFGSAAAVFVITLALLMGSNSWIGITYDEPIYQSKSVQVVRWLQLLFSRPSLAISNSCIAMMWQATDKHPGFYKLATAACGVTLGRLVGYDATWRTGTNLLCALCFAALYGFVGSLWGHWTALYAVGALFLMPRVFGHCHLAALDAPIMAMGFLTLVAAWRACDVAGGTGATGRRNQWAWALAAGAIWGLALGTKLNAFFVPFIIFPWAALFARRQLGKLAVGFAVLGPAVFVGTWPWLWHETWPRFVEYFTFHFRHYPISVMYFGTEYVRAPWHYPLVMTAITLPPSILGLMLVGLYRAGAVRKWLGADGQCRRRAMALVLVLWALFVNIAPSCLPASPKYGGVRLFLPVFPFIAIIAAVGFGFLLKRVTGFVDSRIELRRLRMKVAVIGLFAALIGPLAAIAKFTPYYLSYYNMLIGGLPGAARAGMEPTYWGDTYRTAALWLAEHAEQGATVWIEPMGFESTVRLFELGPLRPDLQFASGREGFGGADYAVTQNKPTEFTDITRRLTADERPVFTDGIDGVPLIYVFTPG